MELLAREERTLFLGYNVLMGSRAYGTLSRVPAEKCLETPVAENLMAGMAIGMAMEGLRPVLFYERHDFMLNALDALVNHLDKIDGLSRGRFKAPVIIRAVVGGTKPIYPGLQHTQDFSPLFRSLFRFPVLELGTEDDIPRLYQETLTREEPVMFIERKDLYESEWRGPSDTE